jgi:hypothetical protein
MINMLLIYAGQLNTLTHLRALLILHDRGISLRYNYMIIMNDNNEHAYAG